MRLTLKDISAKPAVSCAKAARLIIVDDFQAARPFTKHEQKWLDAYIEGWYVPGVRTVEQTISFANKHHLQLKKNDELTPYLRLRNLPDLSCQHRCSSSARNFPSNMPSSRPCWGAWHCSSVCT
jgi:hypothetical protein